MILFKCRLTITLISDGRYKPSLHVFGQPISWSMAAIFEFAIPLTSSSYVAAVVPTRPRAIPLAMITNLWFSFPFLFEYGVLPLLDYDVRCNAAAVVCDMT